MKRLNLDKHLKKHEHYAQLADNELGHIGCEIKMYVDWNDSGLDGDSFRATLEEYVHCNHYDSEARKIDSNWDLTSYDIVKKILGELKMK